MLTLDDLAARLDRATVKGDNLSACCPAHDDSTPSLTATTGDTGAIVLHCHAGCDQSAVMAALKVEPADLFPATTNGNGRHMVATYDYMGPDGELVGQVVRFEPKDFRQRRPDGEGGWVWKGARLPLYRLPDVLRAVEAGRAVWLCEGEKDADALQRVLPEGEVATTAPGGAGKWRDEFTAWLTGADAVIVRDRDKAGAEHAEQVAAALRPVAAVKVLEPAHGKDAADHLGAGYSVGDFVPVDLEPEAGDDEDGERSSWAPVENPASFEDITPLPPPTILTRDDGKALFYEHAINGVHGQSTEGKSWVAKLAAGREMAAGNHVVYVDHEDAYEQATTDLVLLGFDYDQFRPFWHYVAPEEPLINRQGAFTPGWFAYLDALERYRPTLVVLDGVTDGMNLHSLSPSENDDYATWRKVALTPAAKVGAAVLTVDHVTKNDSKGFAIGAQHKRAGMTGASYEVKTITPFARGHDGAFKLICRKAKRGHWRKGEVVAEFHVTSHDDGRLTIEPRTPSAGATDEGEDWVPTVLMDRVSAWLEANPGEHSQTKIRDAVKGRGEWVDAATDALVEHGYVKRRTQGRAKYHAHLDRYHDGDELTTREAA